MSNKLLGDNREKLIQELKHDEGQVLHAYQDHLGYWTIGIGRLIDKRKGGGISESESEALLAKDIESCSSFLQEQEALIDESGKGLLEHCNKEQARALANMVFQLGEQGFLGFRNMVTAIKRDDWSKAKEEALDSQWAKQTPARAKRVTGLF